MTLEIMGQILKNYYGFLVIERILTEKEIASSDRATNIAVGFLLNMITALTKFFLKKVSYDVIQKPPSDVRWF